MTLHQYAENFSLWIFEFINWHLSLYLYGLRQHGRYLVSAMLFLVHLASRSSIGSSDWGFLLLCHQAVWRALCPVVMEFKGTPDNTCWCSKGLSLQGIWASLQGITHTVLSNSEMKLLFTGLSSRNRVCLDSYSICGNNLDSESIKIHAYTVWWKSCKLRLF